MRALLFARAALGTPYVWGGESSSGYDCSGLVQAAFRAAGVSIPRTTFQQIHYGQAVGWGQLQPGDLVFSNFEGPGAGATHVVIYIGHGQVIAAPHTGAKVEVEPLSWFQGNFVGARRIVAGPNGQALPTTGLPPIGNPGQAPVGPTGDGHWGAPTPNPPPMHFTPPILPHFAPLETATQALQNLFGAQSQNGLLGQGALAQPGAPPNPAAAIQQLQSQSFQPPPTVQMPTVSMHPELANQLDALHSALLRA